MRTTTSLTNARTAARARQLSDDNYQKCAADGVASIMSRLRWMQRLRHRGLARWIPFVARSRQVHNRLHLQKALRGLSWTPLGTDEPGVRCPRKIEEGVMKRTRKAKLSFSVRGSWEGCKSGCCNGEGHQVQGKGQARQGAGSSVFRDCGECRIAMFGKQKNDDDDGFFHGVVFFGEIENNNIDSLNDGWFVLEVLVDSGACNTVMPIGLTEHIQSHESPGSNAANGTSIDNVGERRCWGSYEGGGDGNNITQFQVANVKTALLSVTECPDMGYECILVAEGGFLQYVNSG